MQRPITHALKRADRAIAIVGLLVASFTAGVFFGVNVPNTEPVAMAAVPVAPSLSKLAQAARAPSVAQQTASVAPSLRPYSFGDDAVAVPASISSNDVTSSSGELIRLAPAAEATLVRILQDQRCLAEAMYYEARGEGREGQEAIAEVVFHRMKSPGYPHSICGVVYQGAERGHGCQFSFACDGELQLPKSSVAWTKARMLAAKIMAGVVHLGDITGDAVSFHAADIQPDWADTMERTIQIGNHVFYRSTPREKSS